MLTLNTTETVLFALMLFLLGLLQLTCHYRQQRRLLKLESMLQQVSAPQPKQADQRRVPQETSQEATIAPSQ